jgi:hypothetical protein
MPLIINQFNGVFGFVFWVINGVAALVGFRIFDPSCPSLDSRWKIVSMAGVDRFPPVGGEVLEEGVLAGYSRPFSCWCCGVCALSAERALSGAASKYSGQEQGHNLFVVFGLFLQFAVLVGLRSGGAQRFLSAHFGVCL